jgi:hypothetical protein
MSIKNHELYPKYLIWLEEKKMDKGMKELSKMSQSFFDRFKLRYELNPSLKERIDNKYKSIERQERIEDIIDDDFFDFD